MKLEQIIKVIINSVKHMLSVDQDADILVKTITLSFIKELSHIYNKHVLI